MFFSMYQGGITPIFGPRPVRVLIVRAHGRTSSYVMSDIGATPLGRWQFWQLRCRIGAISFANVTCCSETVCPTAGTGIVTAVSTPSITSTLRGHNLQPLLHVASIGTSVTTNPIPEAQ